MTVLHSQILICLIALLIIWMKFQRIFRLLLTNNIFRGEAVNFKRRLLPLLRQTVCINFQPWSHLHVLLNLSYKIIKYLALSLVNWYDWMKVHEYSCHILCNNRIWVFLSWHNSPSPNCLSIFLGNKLNLPEILWVIIVGDSCR